MLTDSDGSIGVVILEGDKNVQMERAAQLQRAWKTPGNPPCVHPTYEAEYYFGHITGCVCTNCGAYLDLANLEYHLPKPE